jgi:gas vesicle protein
MYYENDSNGLPFLTGVVVGVAIGAGLALLVAPQSGRRTRRRLARTVEDVADDAVGRWDDVADEFRSAVKSGRKKLDL